MAWFSAATDLIIGNVSMGLPEVITFVVIISSIIFYAKDFKLGLVMDFLFSTLLFMWFYAAGWDYIIPLILMFVFLASMALTLLPISQVSKEGGFI